VATELAKKTVARAVAHAKRDRRADMVRC
jgi:hypothetical protein